MKKIIFSCLVFMHALPSSHARNNKSHFTNTKISKVDENTIHSPVDNEVCFSPDEPCDLKLVKFIESAEKSIDVAIYSLNLDSVVHTLAVKSKKGLNVRVVVDKQQSSVKQSLISTLIKTGVNVRFGKQKGYMHNKFVIIDGKRLETGSFNYTHHATTANHENQVYLNTPSVIERFQKQFEEICKDTI